MEVCVDASDVIFTQTSTRSFTIGGVTMSYFCVSSYFAFSAMKISLNDFCLKNADDFGTHVEADADELGRVSAAAASSVGGGRPPRLVNEDRAAPDEELGKDEVALVIVVGMI